MGTHLSRKMLKKALDNMKSLLDEEGKPRPLKEKIPLAKELEEYQRRKKKGELKKRRKKGR